jgi:hypothetical protein
MIYKKTNHDYTRKCSSQGQGGRSRSTKISLSTMNKHKKKSHKAYRGQGR